MKTYFKPTNHLLYLPANSHHPMVHKLGVIRGEAIRLLRNSSDKTVWLEALEKVFKGLMARGYQPAMIQREWKRIRFEEREDFISKDSTRQKPEGTMVLTRFHPRLRETWKQLLGKYPVKRYLHIGRSGRYTKKQREIMKDWPPHVIFKDFNKLGKHMYRARDNTIENN